MGLFDIFSGKSQKKAADAKIAGINQGRTDAFGAIDKGQAGFDAAYGKAQDLYGPLAAIQGQRAGAYDDASGVNGAEGLARARALFTAMPGYQEGIDMASDQAMRTANARGDLAGGNTLADLARLSTNYASQKYSDYMAGLRPFVGADAATTGARAGLYTAQGDQAFNAGALKGGIGFQAGQAIGNAQAEREMADYNAAGNLWNAVLGAGKMVAGLSNGKGIKGIWG